MRPSFDHAAFYVSIEITGAGDRTTGGEHHLGGFGGDLLAGVGRTGLHDDRPALHRAGMVQRAANLEVLALVVQHMHLVGIEEDAAFLVADPGIVRPAIPQTGHDLIELAPAVIALPVLDMLLQAEIQSCIGVRRGDQIPAGSAVADVVQRRELAGDVIRIVERGRGGGDQSKPFGDHGQRGQQRQRIEGRIGGAALQRAHGHVQHRQVVGHEERVELAALQRLREPREMLEIEVGVGIGAGIAPPRGVDPHRAHECPQPQHFPLRHALPPRPNFGYYQFRQSVRKPCRKSLGGLPMDEELSELARLIEDADRVVVFTGAGISTESGIPDFRSPGGTWTKQQPIDFSDFLRSDEARRETWRRRFEMEPTLRQATPNRGHRAVAELIRRGKASAVITQNIDGLHQDSGHSGRQGDRVARQHDLRALPGLRHALRDRARCGWISRRTGSCRIAPAVAG